MEFTGWVLLPAEIVKSSAEQFWDRYVGLVGVKEENDQLQDRVDNLRRQLASAREKVLLSDRLLELLDFTPPPGWISKGVRIVGQQLGPNALLETLIVDKGAAQGVPQGAPFVSPDGVVGRGLRQGLNFTTLLLVTDPNSRIPVISQRHRTAGILYGQGADHPLSLRYVPLNAEIDKGELLVTSGLAGIYPKGLPIARVSSLTSSDISLFQDITAVPMVKGADLEELLVLVPVKGESDEQLPVRAFPGEGGPR